MLAGRSAKIQSSMIRLAQTTICTCTFLFKILAFLLDSKLKITTRNAMFGALAIFALFGQNLGIELSLGKETEAGSTFEADCTIIDTVKKLSSRLWLSSESLNDEQLEVALAKSRRKNRKLKNTKKAKERKQLVNAKHFSFAGTESLKENETSAIPEELLNEQEESSETNIANETAERTNISVVINSSFVSTEEVDTNKTMSPLLLSSCEYIDLTILQKICGPGFAADFTTASQSLHQTIFFDVGSGHTILGVHSEPRCYFGFINQDLNVTMVIYSRWQCCRRREDRTEGVGCRMGATCPAPAKTI